MKSKSQIEHEIVDYVNKKGLYCSENMPKVMSDLISETMLEIKEMRFNLACDALRTNKDSHGRGNH